MKHLAVEKGPKDVLLLLQKKMQILDDTIAAIATPVGVGGIGIVRISGPDSLSIARRFLKKKDIKNNYAYHVWLPDNIDEVLLTFFKSPRSFTGEDILEISCHGSPFIVKKVLSLIIDIGVRQARNGEFTKRAFLNGKIDLVQAESVLSMVSSHSSELARISAFQLKGGLSNMISQIQNACLKILSEVQASIDFPDDILDGEFLEKKIQTIIANIDSILLTNHYGKIIRNGITAVIAGKPNVGKSSLLNALLNEDRSIVTEIPGTTRDAIIESINIKGVIVRLVDTAGIRPSSDVLEGKGIETSTRQIEAADLILLALDGSRPIDDEDLEVIRLIGDKPYIKIYNKSDLGASVGQDGLNVSALTGIGIKSLEDMIYEFVIGDNFPMVDAVLTSERQASSLSNAKKSLQKAIETVKMGKSVDLVSIDLQDSVLLLGEILGTDIGDQVLDVIFSEFCVGK